MWWALCSNVCSCGKTEDGLKVDSTSVQSLKKPGAGSEKPKARLTMLSSGAGSNAIIENQCFEDTKAPTAVVIEAQANLEPGAPQAVTDGADLPIASEFPAPKNLIKEVLRPSQIFNIAQHEFIAFGSSTVLRGTQAMIEKEYEEKRLEVSGAKNADELRDALQSLGIAIHCRKGKKPEQPNQDNILFCKMANFTIFGVADGHGPDGHWASHWTVRHVLWLLITEVKAAGRLPGNEAFTRIFDLAHSALQCRAAENRFDLNMSGTTLSVCIIDHSLNHIVAAWVGDSRCATVRPNGVKGHSLTFDHKPQDKEERERIKASGGEVVAPGEHDVPHRVFVKGGEVPGLAMSRAVGDCIAHSVGVIHTPGIVRAKLEDHCVLCCSDGVWEFIESAEGGEMVSKMGRGRCREATEALCLKSRDLWIKEEEFITDDISGICVWV